MSNAEKKNKIPDAPTPAAVPGNLLSSVPPPSQLPNFAIPHAAAIPSEMLPPGLSLPQSITSVPQTLPTLPQTVPTIPQSMPSVPQSVPTLPQTVPTLPQTMPTLPQTVPTIPQTLPTVSQVAPIVSQPVSGVPNVPQYPEENFSAAIPLCKGEPLLPIRSPEDSAAQSPMTESLPDSLADVDKLGDVMPGSGLITWVRGAVASGGLLQRVAEKAKNSVDSIVTTLDPQMKEYLRSGGDIYVVVSSDKDVKVSPVREAFQTVFGKATVVGMPAQSDVTASQPVGYSSAYAACKQRIAVLRSTHAEITNNVPVVAIESYLFEPVSDRWFEISLLVLSQPSLGIEVQQLSQGTAVPSAAVTAARAATPPDYPHSLTGLATAVGSIMGASLQVPHSQWQEATTGVSRRELLVLASRALAGAYKKLLAVSAAET